MKHAPRGPVKGRADLISVGNPLVVEHLNGSPARCTSKSKRTGKQCRNPARAGATVCRTHGGNAPQVQASARERLMALQPLAVQTLHNLLQREEFPTVQLGAAKDVLDRTDGKAGETLTVNVTLAVVSERLLAARKRLAANRENP